MKAKLTRVLGLSILALAGCGEAASSDYAPPIATLHGHLSGEVAGIAHPLRVALVWETPGHLNYVVQESAIHPEFPARFKLTLTEPPPEAAMQTGLLTAEYDSIRVAVGHLAVYEDLNDNGSFDLIPADAHQRIDRLLSDGEGGRIEVSYYEGAAETLAKIHTGPIVDCVAGAPCPQPPQYTILPGFNIFHERAEVLTGDDCLERPCHSRVPFLGQWIARDADIEVPLHEPTFSSMQCQSWKAAEITPISSNGECPGNVVPQGWGILCLDNPFNFPALSPQDPNLPICTVSSQQCLVTRSQSDPPPPSWPCL